MHPRTRPADAHRARPHPQIHQSASSTTRRISLAMKNAQPYEDGLRVALPNYTVQTSFSTCSKPSSTGVSRPKIDTSTVSFCVDGSTSDTTADIVANGPSVTVT